MAHCSARVHRVTGAGDDGMESSWSSTSLTSMMRSMIFGGALVRRRRPRWPIARVTLVVVPGLCDVGPCGALAHIRTARVFADGVGQPCITGAAGAGRSACARTGPEADDV